MKNKSMFDIPDYKDMNEEQQVCCKLLLLTPEDRQVVINYIMKLKNRIAKLEKPQESDWPDMGFN